MRFRSKSNGCLPEDILMCLTVSIADAVRIRQPLESVVELMLELDVLLPTEIRECGRLLWLFMRSPQVAE